MATATTDSVNCLSQAPDQAAPALGAPKSRRAIITGMAAAMVATPAIASSGSDDPIYPIWREWRTLFEQHWAADNRAADIHNALPEWVTTPRVLVMVGKYSKREFWASTPEEIREIMGFNHGLAGPINPQNVARAKALDAELEQAKKAAEVEYERSGCDALWRHADSLWEQMVPLAKQIKASPSTSAIAIAAKLDMAYASMADIAQDLGNPPISYMGYVLRSLWSGLPADMQDALRPAADHDGIVAKLYDGRALS